MGQESEDKRKAVRRKSKRKRGNNFFFFFFFVVWEGKSNQNERKGIKTLSKSLISLSLSLSLSLSSMLERYEEFEKTFLQKARGSRASPRRAYLESDLP